mmetsp:Transcript_35671/g.119235  ORF Transcript_35671/g.119235 Transcript_35671/m.119235 type:complete len:363 (+) Transcript_35671:389-1477(+)
MGVAPARQPGVAQQLLRRRAPRRLLVEAAAEQVPQRGGEVPVGGQRRRGLVRNLAEQLVECASGGGVRVIAASQLEEDEAEGPDVGAVRVGLCAQTLGRHVAGGADKRRAELARRLELRRDPEVGDLDGALRVEEHVCWLEVSVHLPLLVQVGETAQHLLSHAPHLRLVAKSARLAVLLDQVGERTGIHELHRRVHARLFVEGVVQGDQPRAAVLAHDSQLRDRLQPLGGLEDGHLLERKDCARGAVPRAEDCPASAMAELVERLDVGHALDLDAARRHTARCRAGRARALGSSGLAQPEVSSARVESKVVHAKGAGLREEEGLVSAVGRPTRGASPAAQRHRRWPPSLRIVAVAVRAAQGQ